MGKINDGQRGVHRGKYGDTEHFQCKASNDGVELRVGAMSLFVDAEEEVHGRNVKRLLEMDTQHEVVGCVRRRRGVACCDKSGWGNCPKSEREQFAPDYRRCLARAGHAERVELNVHYESGDGNCSQVCG